MLLIPTTIGPSFIQGIGLFAATDIPKDTVIWKWDPSLDMEILWSTALTWPQPAQEFLHTYAYRNVEHQTWMLCGDATRHMNHSFKPNVHSQGPYGEDITMRDIQKGEELTIDYRQFDPDFERESENYH